MNNEIKCACCDETIAVRCSECAKYVDMKCVAGIFTDKETGGLTYVCDSCIESCEAQ